LAVAGCTRTHYRLRADLETYSILNEKSASTPWRLPFGFAVDPDPRSRFCDATPTDDPWLPVPAPQLYAYSLPDLPERDPSRFRSHTTEPNDVLPFPHLSSSENHLATVQSSHDLRLGPTPTQSASDGATHHLTDAHSPRMASPNANSIIQQVSYQEDPAELTPENQPATEDQALGELYEEGGELIILPIPDEIWQSLPQSCLIRMFEFASIREEYAREYDHEPTADQRDQSQRLALEDIVELALINSREYQTQKEILYHAALRLSLERFDYDMKFATGGNRNEVNYSHSRNAGLTDDELRIPTTLTENAVLATGGDLLASFANNVVLTFNGPSGFAADVGSDLLLDISQNLFQRDVVLERLTQAERNVVYAARDFMRFRRQFFVDLAARYYGLLLTYREIEIAAQTYFSNLRGFQQVQAQYRADQLPRFQVDQFEQDVLANRSSLINSCNRLEGSMDSLKLDIGLPPELPVNLDLTELEELTHRDEQTAAAERVKRARRNVSTELREDEPDREMLLNVVVELVSKMLNLIEFRQRDGDSAAHAEKLKLLLDQLKVDEAEWRVRLNVQALTIETGAQQPQLQSIFRRTLDLVNSLLSLIDHQLVLGERSGVSDDEIAAIRDEIPDLRKQHKELEDDLGRAIRKAVENSEPLKGIPELVQSAEALFADVDDLSARTTALVPAPQFSDEELRGIAEELVRRSQSILEGDIGGLVPVEIEMDDAMLTALTLRFDLVNERGELADTWRQIKLAGDDLKSILNLRATQQIRTRSDLNRPFDFTFDDSQTQLSMTFDAPLNRKTQRNQFRVSLINYNAGLRELMALEDRIKLSVRNDLRQLQVDREQYQISVASAALAYDRLISTRMQLLLGYKAVSVRDVLESQDAYTRSLVALARTHIDYILDRIQLFHDLELLRVDDTGFWPMLYDEQFQPEPNYQLPFDAGPVYGDLPRRTLHSRKIKRMLCVPAGEAIIFDTGAPQPSSSEELPAPQPDPSAGLDSQE